MERRSARTSVAREDRVDVVSFGEHDLDDLDFARPHGRPAHDASRCGLTLLSELERCADGAARRRLWRAALQKAGFRWLCYWRIACVGERVRHAACFDTYCPPGWLEGFRSDGFFDVDPRIVLARGRDWPFAWDVASLFATRPSLRANPIARRFIASAAKAGMHSGVTVGLPMRRASERAIVTLSSASMDRRWLTDTAIGEAYAVALALHAFIEPRARRLMPHSDAETATDPVNAQQLDVLRLVSKGATNREIAERLAISTHVVARHLSHLEQKYAARNRVQLAYIAGGILRE